MVMPARIASGLLLSATLWSGAFAAQVATTAAAPSMDCRWVGNTVSALIDSSASSPNLAAAQAAFQLGIMECMEGDDDAANEFYQKSAALLTGNPPSGVLAQVAPPAQVAADCQTVGASVSALIDASPMSPNISAAKAAFQRGIMECMEGDDIAANEVYQEAKTFLTGN